MRGLFGTLFLAAAFIVWYAQRHTKAAAIAAARQACRSINAELLDETVCQTRYRWCRSPRGTLALERLFVFDYCPDGMHRESGSVLLTAGRVEAVVLASPKRAGGNGGRADRDIT